MSSTNQTVKIVRNSSVAFTWNSDGSCCAVKLEATSRGFRVAAFWEEVAKTSKSSAIAETLAQGRKKLGENDALYCVAGTVDGGWGMADLLLPKLKESDIRSALSFELRKRTPLPADRLTWGYRVVSVLADKIQVRLFYVRTDAWRNWMGAAAGLTHVDLVIPPAVVLDPVLGGKSVVFPGVEPFEYVPGNQGRDVLPYSQKLEDSRIQELLPLEGLDWGELASQPPEKQRKFFAAIVLATYGLTRELTKDIETLPKVTENLRPSRYIALKTCIMCLLAVVVITLGFGGIKAMQLRMARLRLLQADIDIVEKELKVLRGNGQNNTQTALKNLEAEMQKYQFDAPELADVLLTLTEEIKTPAWLAGAFDWSMDQGTNVVPVSFTIREPVGTQVNSDLSVRLNRSPILGDVAENKSSINRAGFAERRFVLKARTDTEEETLELQEELAREKERTAKEAEKARKEAEAQAKELSDAEAKNAPLEENAP